MMLFRTRPCDAYAACDGFLLRPDQPHQVDGASAFSVFLWLEPESEAVRSLLRQTSANGMLSAVQREALVAQHPMILQLAQQAWDCESAKALASRLFAIFTSPSDAHDTMPSRDDLDPRVMNTLSQLSRGALAGTTPSLQLIARDIALSSSRLRHIFAEQLGLSMQSYLLWQRLLNAIELSARGLSLTQAAHDAGFADAAHLTRTFRRMFGVKPSEVFRNSHSVQVFPCLR